MSAITLDSVSKTYRTGPLTVPVLKAVSLQVEQGEMVAVMGPSGSGKSTLMNIVGLLDRPSSGELRLGGEPISLNLSDTALARLRSEKIGFIFQSFNLLPKQSALQNVLLPTLYRKAGRRDRVERAKKLLADLGLADRAAHRPTELSGGEKQRVAIARALMNDPEIILADEPTGNLDSQSGSEVMKVLKKLNGEGKTIVVITHDPKIAGQCDRTVHILDGQLKEDKHG